MEWVALPSDYLRCGLTQYTGMLFYNRPHYEDRESKQLYLTHRDKQREAAKIKRQRNMAQMKEQNKELNKLKISNLSYAEFQTLVIRIGCSQNSLGIGTA